MHSFLTLLPLLASALAARPFLNEPDTGIEDVLGDIAVGTLPPLESIVGLPDFEWAARGYMNTSAYTYYRNGAAGEWSYRNNLEVYNRFRLRPRVLTDITNIESTLPTTILGHNFSAPFFISPCARAGYAHPEAEAGLIRGAAANGILYMPALYATLSIEQIAAAKPANSTQVTFQQVYLDTNNIASQAIFKRAEKAGSKAIIFTVDSAADGNRHRAARYGVGSALAQLGCIPHPPEPDLPPNYSQGHNDRRRCAACSCEWSQGNHYLQSRRSPTRRFTIVLEVALEIHGKAPEVFTQVEVYADGGVRYGADVLKLLSLGVKAVGLGRPFMFANAYGQEGVEKAITLLKHEIAIDAGNLGVGDLKKIDPSFVSWTNNNWYS